MRKKLFAICKVFLCEIKLTFTLHSIIMCCMKVNKKEIIETKILQNQGIIQIADIVAEGILKQYAI